jgi:hypothetical protein
LQRWTLAVAVAHTIVSGNPRLNDGGQDNFDTQLSLQKLPTLFDQGGIIESFVELQRVQV